MKRLPLPRMQKHQRFLYLATSLLIATLFVVSLLFSALPVVWAAGTITGTVFRDFNANGAKEANEPGQAGITVTAYDANNAVQGTAASAADGTYTLTAGGTGPYRIEFTGWPSYLQPAAVGTSSPSSVQFVPDGNATLNFGLNDPAEYCQANPNLCTSQMWNGDNTDPNQPTSGLITFNYGASGTTPAPAVIATKAQIGSTWAHAYERTTKTVYSAAFLKRHSGLGPNGLGAIYATDANGTTSTLFADLAGLGANVGSVPSNSARGLGAPTAPNNDASTYPQIGKVGLGGIAISTDDRTLYAISLNDKTMYALNVPGGTLAGSFPIADPGCTGGAWRPFAVKYWRNEVYVGGVCDAQASQNAADLHAYILRFTPGPNIFTPVLNFPLNYPKGQAAGNGCETFTGWYPWLDTYAPSCRAIGASLFYVHPQPVLSNIEFDMDGSMILGFFDRMGHQFGSANYGLTGNTATEFQAQVGGDILRAYNNNGTYVLENNATAGTVTTAGVGDNQGPGGGEFYYEDYQGAGAEHQEVTEGGLALLPGSGQVVATAMNPFTNETQGIHWFDNTTGTSPHRYEIEHFTGNTLTPDLSSKTNGLGDIELLCDSAPIEIGNRVWRDADGDGVQDAGEPPIAGVTVELVNSAGAVIGTAVTDANGNYLFSNSTTGTSSTSAIYNLPITANTGYTVRVATGQAALTGLLPAPANTDASANGDSRDSDGTVSGAYSQIALTTGNAGANNHTYDFGFIPTYVSIGNQVWYDTDDNGQINGSEVGVDGVQVQLFLDTNNDGVLTGAEQTPIAVQTTSSGGYYLFTQTTNASGVGTGTALSPGQYFVGVASTNFATGGVLAGSRSSGTTISNSGVVSEAAIATNGTTDSNVDNADDGITQTSGFYTGGVLSGPLVVTPGGEPGGSTPGHPNTIDGTAGGTAIPNTSSNPTVDFGFYRQTLGNLVFNDVAIDSIYVPATDTPLAGATVKLFAANGTTELPVGPDGILGTADDAPGGVTTGANGIYLFQSLPQGSYIVKVTPPNGYTSSADIASSATPNDNVDNDDNGLGGGSGTVSSALITLTPGSSGATNANLVDTSTGTTANPTLDFSFYTLSLGNLVWNDVNNNGLKDATETGVDGVTVNLYVDTNGNGVLDAADTPAGSQTTSNNGHYLFTNLTPASYLVQLPPSNFQAGGPLVGYTSSVGINGSATGPYEPGAGGTTDNDDNGTTSTLGIVSGPIALIAGTQPTNELDLGLPTGATDPASNANSNLSVDFGVFLPASLGDFVWFDTDKNGVQGPTESGVDGVQVSLFSPNGKDGIPGNADDALPIATTVTGPNPAVAGSHGYYTFANLAPNTDYTIRLDRASDFTAAGPLAGYTLTSQDQGGNDTLDSDAALIAGVPTISARTAGPGSNTPTFDFGFNTSAALGDYIWLDANNNGVQDATETGINGVTVHLYDAAGTTLIATTVTTSTGSSDGYYHFADLTPGTTYTIKLDNPADYAAGGPLANTTLSPVDQGGNDATDSDATLVAGFPSISAPTGGPGTDTPTYDVSFYRPVAALGDYVWLDTNKNGVQDAGETGINGVTVHLYDSAGNLVDTTKTATNGSALGYYHFSNLIPNTTYTVKLDNPADYAPGGPLEGFQLTPADQGGDDATDSDATLVAGYPTISAAPTGADGSDTPTYDIGVFQPLSLGNLVWNDINDNGLKDASEVGIDGVKVNLYLDTNANGVLDASDTLIASQTTSNGGHYLFIDLGAGTYLVQLDASNFATTGLLAGYTSSTGDTGSTTGPYEPGATSTADNDDNGTNSNGGIVSGPIVLAPNTQPSNEPDTRLPRGVTDNALDSNSNLTVDFGVFPLGRLGDYVWYDTNDNGVQDAGEAGVPGVTVTLYDGNGTPLETTTTDQNGHYQFIDLPPGIYVVGYTNLPSGYTFSPQDQGGNTASDSDANPATGRTLPITLAAGENNPTVDGGIVLAPTAITLSQFGATWQGGNVLINWTTSSEIDTFGFDLLRSSDGTLAHATRVTPALILAQGRGQNGASYSWTDQSVTRGSTYTYWLEETEVGGATNIYGPAEATSPTIARIYRVMLPMVIKR